MFRWMWAVSFLYTGITVARLQFHESYPCFKLSSNRSWMHGAISCEINSSSLVGIPSLPTVFFTSSSKSSLSTPDISICISKGLDLRIACGIEGKGPGNVDSMLWLKKKQLNVSALSTSVVVNVLSVCCKSGMRQDFFLSALLVTTCVDLENAHLTVRFA